jgi:predicted PurR-regulated permease PerM
MEITSFILGVLAVIALAMVAITSVNYMTTKVLKKDIDNLNISTNHAFEDIYRQLENTRQELYSRIDEVEQNVVRHTDSRVDKLESKIYGDLDIKRQQSRQY